MSTSQQPIRVLMLFTILNRGGAETMVMNYLRKIDRTQVIFDFIVHREERGAYDDEVESLGGKIFRFPALNMLHTRSYKKLVSAFFDAHPEYQMVHGHCSELGYFIYKEAHKRGLSFIAAHAHNEPSGFDVKTPVRNVLKKAMRPYLSHYFTCSRGAAKWLFGEELSKKAIFIPNAVDATVLAYNTEKREKIRKENEWTGSVVIGNVARFSHQKNHVFLLDIFAEILRKEPSALLVLIGSGGELEEEIKEQVKGSDFQDRVRFMGSCSNIADLLQGMDLFLFPSHFEGLSVAQLEAQASGLSILNSTGVPKEGNILPELIESLPLSLSAETWADKALEMIKKQNRKDCSAQIAAAGFDINKNAEWLQKLYLKENQH